MGLRIEVLVLGKMVVVMVESHRVLGMEGEVVVVEFHMALRVVEAKA